jgi:hypothetical protein
MTGPTIKAPRKRYPSDYGHRRLKPTHMFRDVGPALAEADFKARAKVQGPEEAMLEAS